MKSEAEQKVELMQRVCLCIHRGTESYEEDNIGVPLAYLLQAILEDDTLEANAVNTPLIDILVCNSLLWSEVRGYYE